MMTPCRDILAKEYDFRVMDSLDEFSTRYIWPRDQIINKESQYYVNPDKVADEDNPFTLSDKGLSIKAKLTPADLLDYAKNQPFVSGVLTTRDKGYSQLFGYWEASIKLPKAGGAWPAFWLLPTFEKWPSGIDVLSEIDIMEAVKTVTEGTYHGTLHTNETGQLVSSKDNDIKTGVDLINEYHTYGLSWDEEHIVWFFDDVEVIRRKTPNDMKQEPRHILLNLAVGGWGGDPVPDDYPVTLDVEWIRVWSADNEDLKPTEKVDALTWSRSHAKNGALPETLPESARDYLVDLLNGHINKLHGH